MPQSRRRKHRAQGSEGGGRASAALTALGTVATVVTVVLVVVGSVLTPSGASLSWKGHGHPHRKYTRVVASKHTIPVHRPTRTVTTTPSPSSSTQTITKTVTASPTASPTGITTPRSTSTSSATASTRSPEVGVYLSGNNAGLDSYTSGWPEQPNVASYYLPWNNGLPTSMKTYASHGRTIEVALMTKISAGNWVRWNSIANGSQDSRIITVVKALDALGVPVLLSLDCEPDAQFDRGGSSPGVAQGQTPAQYVAAANHVADLVHAHATRVESAVHLAGFRTPSIEASFLPAHSKLDNVGWDPYMTGSHPASETATQLFATFINNVLVPYGYDDIPRNIPETGIKTDKFSDGKSSFSTQTQISFYDSIPAAMAADHIRSVIWFRSNSGTHDYIPTDYSVDKTFEAMVDDLLS
jgi:hypothetical protein